MFPKERWVFRRFLYDDFARLGVYENKVVSQALLDLKTDPYIGKALEYFKHHQHHVAPLTGVWRHMISVGQNYYDTLVIVYRIHPEEHEIEIIAVEKRLGSAAYKLAAERLSPARKPPRELPRWERVQQLRRRRGNQRPR